jgi:primosomal replication protein N
MYTKSLQFPLGVTMMTYDLANNISKRTTRVVIGAMHVNRSLLQILAFTGTKLLGLGLQHHYCAQGISHVKQVIQHTRQQDENRKMYKIILKYRQLLAGVQFPILQHLKPKLPHIMDPLITTICQFLVNSQLNIVIPQLYIPRPICENDLNIMGEIPKIEKSPIAIKRVNQRRLFLQITWLSEMTDAPGNVILPEFLE